MSILKVYCDTNVFLDYLEDRKDYLRPLGHLAFDFFARGWNCLYKLVVSDWVIEEFIKHVSKERLDNELLDYFREKNKLIHVSYTDAEVTKAKRISKNWRDALHAIIASREKCDCLITRNQDDFAEFSSMIDIAYPESI